MIRTVWPWLIGWCAAAVLGAVYWSRLHRPRLLRWGGVVQRRSPKLGVFVPGRSPAEAAEYVATDRRFVSEKADV